MLQSLLLLMPPLTNENPFDFVKEPKSKSAAEDHITFERTKRIVFCFILFEIIFCFFLLILKWAYYIFLSFFLFSLQIKK